MKLNLSSDRNHMFSVLIDGICLHRVKIIDLSTKTGVWTEQYDIDKTGLIKITIIERFNSRLLRFIIDFFVLVLGGLAGGADLAGVKSLKYTKGKLELNVISEDLEDAIRIRQIVGNPPFKVKLLHASPNCGYEILFNGRFKGTVRKQIRGAINKAQ